RVVAFEPDRRCASTLRRRFALSRRHIVVEAACGSFGGKQPLYIESSGSAFNTLSPKWRDAVHHGDGGKVDVNVVTLQSPLSTYGQPDYVKIDVEGYEHEVLLGLESAVPVISIEANLPVFEKETIACIDRIAELSASYRYRFVTDVSEGWLTRAPVDAAEAKR